MPNDHLPAPEKLSDLAHANASNLENLAKTRMHTDGGPEDNQPLLNAWLSMTREERNEAAKALDQDYNNHKWDALPIPTVHFDASGDCNAIEFKVSSLDLLHEKSRVSLANDHNKAVWCSAD